MFEEILEKKRSPVFKLLPVAVVIFAGVFLAVNYLGFSRHPAPEALEDVLRAGDPDFDWYSKHVVLRDPKISMARNMAGGRIVVLSGVVENYGERDLDVIEIKVVFFNYEDPVWETVRTPIRPGPRSDPIESLQERAFTFVVQEIPEGWLASHAEMWLHGFRFVADRDG